MKTSSTTTSSAPGHLKRPHKSTEHKSKQQIIDDLSRELDQQKLAYEAQAKDIQHSQARLQESSVGFEAMVVLFKYITENVRLSCFVFLNDHSFEPSLIYVASN